MIEYSVIIPVFNCVQYTENCVVSLYEAKTGDSCFRKFEIIVVDNNSTDGTKKFLEESRNKHSNFHYITNDDNYGFARACNIGAYSAKGEYLIFLNNDTEVTCGWDEYLCDTIKRDSDIWIVGSKCLYDDNTIQHAGVVFGDDKVPFHVFRDFPADFAPANIETECRCVTGACFIIKKENFTELGGFDEIYINGMEDVDLCLKVVKRGKKIVYQPKSVIKHHESKTPGRGGKISQNRKIFAERWGDFIVPDAVMHYWKTGTLAACGNSKQMLHIFKDHPLFHTIIEISPKLEMNEVLSGKFEAMQAEVLKKEEELNGIYNSKFWRITKKFRKATDRLGRK